MAVPCAVFLLLDFSIQTVNTECLGDELRHGTASSTTSLLEYSLFYCMAVAIIACVSHPSIHLCCTPKPALPPIGSIL